MNYYDVYKKRLNRYGLDYQSRVQGQREREFEDYLVKSVYRINFEYDTLTHPGTLEPYKQEDSNVVSYLLVRVNLELPIGTILMLPNKDNLPQPWMVWYLEDYKASGYNRYIVLRMSTQINGTWGYLKGPKKTPVRDTVKSSKTSVLYEESEYMYLFITPYDKIWQKDYYFELNVQNETLGFVVRAVDILSTDGISYVSIDPEHLHNPEEQDNTDNDNGNDDMSFWLTGGK